MRRGLLLSSTLVALGLASTPAAAQDPAEDLFQLYVASVMYPEYFDRTVRERSAQFTPAFMTHFNRVEARLFDEGRRDAEICNQHADANDRFKCNQENPAGGLWLWCQSVRLVIVSGTAFERTQQGEAFIFAKRQFDELIRGQGMGDWVSWMRMGLQATEAQLRAYLR